MTPVLRQHAEIQCAHELEELQKADNRQRPTNWALSPWAVTDYLLGVRLNNGFEVTPKYIGSRRRPPPRPLRAGIWTAPNG
jgi:hypothetical protein